MRPRIHRWTIALVLLAVVPLAFAGDVAVTNTAAPTPWWVPLVLGFFGILSTVITTVVLPTWKKLIDARAAAEDAKGARSVLTTVALKTEHFAEVVQANIDATMRPALAQALADGKLEPAEIAELRALGLAQLKILFGTAGLAELKSALGLADDGAVEHYLQGMLEKKIDQVNAAAAGLPSLPSAPSVPAAIPDPAPTRP